MAKVRSPAASASSSTIRSAGELRDLGEYVRGKNTNLDLIFPEWKTFEADLQHLIHLGEVKIHGFIRSQKYEMPLITVTLGNPEATTPVLGFFGGVHGLERIGSQVVLALLHSFTGHCLWDKLSEFTLQNARLLFFPFVNPIGILQKSRCNPNNVDLMRNAPVDAEHATSWVGGHRQSPRLPWYRGAAGGPMEREAQVLVDFVQSEMRDSSSIVTMDFHSGFGLQDQIWFPYAYTQKPFPHLAEIHAFKESLEQIHPFHFYKIEPQAKIYSTHGDLWDYLHIEWLKRQPSKIKSIYLPLCLEMGSWAWVRKNPLQLLTSFGLYNPMKEHRQRRILRRHYTLFDFLIRAQASGGSLWSNLDPVVRNRHHEQAIQLWYQ